MLGAMASLSRLFSESEVPYLDYRLAENLFCRYFNAENDARACTAYDAHFPTLGVGIKTFTLHNEASTEKIAEFNRLSPILAPLRDRELAIKLGEFRNERMLVSNNAYGITDSIYHIVGRERGALKLFNLPYEFVDTNAICDVVDNGTSVRFNDGRNEYAFNRSKSVLMKKFKVPPFRIEKGIDILADPISALSQLAGNDNTHKAKYHMERGVDYVMLPLYSIRDNKVPERSGLNQWNAAGRARDENEIYIPIPSKINRLYPDFFPPQDHPFELVLPDSSVLLAKKCQEGGKALMSNPNSALGEWLLRKVMGLRPGHIVTMRDLQTFGFDSVLIQNMHSTGADTGLPQYSIRFGEISETYNDFIEQ